MLADDYSRLDIARPPFMPAEYWEAVEREAARVCRSIDAGDDSQALNDIKCLVEAIAKVTMEINGTPAAGSASFDGVVKQAHTLLAGQPGHGLANDSIFGRMATQASKIAQSLGSIRNEYGGGHGRARTASTSDEMVDLALDGGLTWARWALRRIGYFAEGRPEQLISDLVVVPATFHSGALRQRLHAANLPGIEDRHQRAIGVAVGQRVMRQTFVVRIDGLDPCVGSDDLTAWPRGYRLGLAYGLWFDPDDHVTLTPWAAERALRVLEPVEHCGDELWSWVTRIEEAGFQPASSDWGPALDVIAFVNAHARRRPADENPALVKLAALLEPRW